VAKEAAARHEGSLEWFACPNPDCPKFNQFAGGNLSVAERMGKNKAIRRLYCNYCQHRFSERQGSLMRYAHLPQETVERIIKCLTYGCSEEATADICLVDARSVQRLLKVAGPRCEDFHQLQLERLEHPVEVVELDELHAKMSRPPQGKKREPNKAGSRPLIRLAMELANGFTWPWR
jgi:transposase-like protein